MAEALVTLPDGRQAMLRGDSIAEVHRLAREAGLSIAGQNEAAGTNPVAFNNAFQSRMLGAASNVAERTLNVPGEIINPLLRGAFGSTGVSVHDSLPAGPQASPPQIPRVELPTGRQIASALESPLQAILAGQSLGDAYSERLADRQRVASDRAGMDFLGGTAADAAQLAAMRAPARAGRAGGAFDGLVNKGAQALRARINPANVELGTRAAGSSAVSGLETVARGLGRIGEAGLEGAIIGVLQDGDPQELAATAAGVQAGGSAMNTLRNVMIGPPGEYKGGRIAGSLVVGALALGAVYKLTPGDAGSPGEWLEDNLDKVIVGTVAGIGLGLAGRRGAVSYDTRGAIQSTPNTLGGFFPGLADVLSTWPRASLIEMARGVAEDQRIARAMQNAPALGESDSKRLAEIMQSDDPVNGIRNWMETTPRIRRMLGAPDPRLADVPVRED